MISIIIPTLNEENLLEKTLFNIHSDVEEYEIIVSDGGSGDKTCEIANNHPKVTLVRSRKGRAIQMNEGAKVAQGQILLFLHADTLLESGALELIKENLDAKEAIAGSFYLKFDEDRTALKIYSWFSKFNHPLFTYGDQAFFIKREAFLSLKGFANLPIMEDLEIQKRLRRTGKFIKLNKPVTTSSRRFKKSGVLWQQIKNIYLVFLFLIGVPPAYIKKHYKDESRLEL